MRCADATFHARDYDLAATLNSGQAFRWREVEGAWENVIADRWVRLTQERDVIRAQTGQSAKGWRWLDDYLQTDVNLAAILKSFPKDEPMRNAICACRGLRLLRQDPWECLIAFICSSSKQIVQIQQILITLCERYGQPVQTPPGHPPAFAFPTPERLAARAETELRSCRMGFRAPYVRTAAIEVASGNLRFEDLAHLPIEAARERLMRLPGVGLKIADCVLLFSGMHPRAFPMDVWIKRALCRLYFRRVRASESRLRKFSATYFGPWAGYAQQYLFHYMRLHHR